MKKHVFLTSLLAIGMACTANAATDVTFGGEYTNNSGATVKVADGFTPATYTYVASTGEQTGISQDTAPDLEKFTYVDKDNNPKDFSTELLTQADYVADSAVDGTIVTTSQSVAAGATADRANYSYVDGYGETTTLGAAKQDIVTTHALNDEFTGGKEITITNGVGAVTEPSVSDYSFELNGETFTLGGDGSSLLSGNLDVTANVTDSNPELKSKFEAAQAAFAADKLALTDAIAANATKTQTESDNFDAAVDAFDTDSATIETLNTRYASIATAQGLLDAANAAQLDAQEQNSLNDELFKAAKETFNAPILETIENGASNAISASVAGGEIKTALDSKVNVSDLNDKITEYEGIFAEKEAWVGNTLGIDTTKENAVNAEYADTNYLTGATNLTDADVALDSAIKANADNITANTTAIETEVERATAAELVLDEKIAANTAAIAAGDELTLNAAKAYVDSQGALSLQKANEYTDSKVNSLEKELSAGIASAAAMSSVAVSGVSKGEVSVGGGYGYYNSQSAVAFGAAMGLTDNWSVNAAAGLADSNVTFRAGTNYKFKLF